MPRPYIGQALTVNALAREISARQAVEENTARDILADAVESIVRSIKAGRRVHLTGLGTFRTRDYKAMTHTTHLGKTDVPARAYPVFNPAKHLRALPPRGDMPDPQRSIIDECPFL